jgi:hypothetical protein
MAATRLAPLVNYYLGLYKLQYVVLPDPEAGDEGLSYRWYNFDNRLELPENAGCHWPRLMRVEAGNMVETWKWSLRMGKKHQESY